MNTKSEQSLISDGKFRILEYLFENLKEPQYLREISRKTKLSASIVKRHLEVLVKSKILNEERKGSNIYFNYNKNNILINAVFAYICYEKLGKLEYKRKNAIINFIKENNEKSKFTILFGSTAKETYSKESDIDILICVEDKQDVRVLDTSKYEALYNLKINPIMITFEEFRQQNNTIKQIISTGYCLSGFENYYGEIL